MSSELFIEIGSEEIPAGYLEPAVTGFAADLKKRLDALGLGGGAARTWATPRRLAVAIDGIIDERPLEEKEITGPPAAVAFKDGEPTKAAIGFAKKQGVEADAIKLVDTERGQYAAILKKVGGEKTADLLPELIGEAIAAIHFPKSMRWGASTYSYARPLHWLAAIFGGAPVPAKAGAVTGGSLSRGHRFLAPAEFEITGADDWVAKCLDAKVMVDIENRRETIREGIAKLAADQNLAVVKNEKLVAETANLVEWPVPMIGAFEEEYLEMPREVPETAMGSHQRYFAVENKAGELTNRFITISNMVVPDEAVVVSGNERVIRARLSDAAFFWKDDLKTPLDEFAGRLEGVVFLAELGSSAEKVGRFRRLAAKIADAAGLDEKTKSEIDRAATICKADLESAMVYEFPELQGIMGRHYAKAGGESEAVAIAIAEHYRPRFAGDAPPASEVGAVISLADKIDTVCGCFAVGRKPTGAADPLGLRRAVLGVISILLSNESLKNISINYLVSSSFEILIEDGIIEGRNSLGAPSTQHVLDLTEVIKFIETRFGNYLEGFTKDLIDAVLSLDISLNQSLVVLKKRIEALEEFKDTGDWDSFVTTFKRVVNIVSQGYANDEYLKPHDNILPFSLELCNQDEEKKLAEAVDELEKSVSEAVKNRDYFQAFKLISEKREFVDKFFDNVLVNDEDVEIRRNRYRLLLRLNNLFAELANILRIST